MNSVTMIQRVSPAPRSAPMRMMLIASNPAKIAARMSRKWPSSMTSGSMVNARMR